jgi:ABC-type transport system involved in multi-copper enzyme maturation permease subunit
VSTEIRDTVPPAPPALADGSAGSGHANFGRLVAAEWTKLRTVRSTIWSFVALIVVSIGLTVLITSVTVATWNDTNGRNNANPHANLLADPVATIFSAGLGLGQLAMCVLGVMVATSEYSTGMIRSTLLASPHRLRTLAAKGIAFVIPVFIVGEILGFACFAIGSAILKSHVSVSLSGPYVLRSVVGVGLYLGMLGLFAMAIGQIIRHTAGAITATIALVIVIDPLAGLLPDSWGAHVSGYLPNNAGVLLMDPTPTGSNVLSAWEGFAVFGIWTALLLAIASWMLIERDA